jgi:hypothetical protein
VKRTGTVSVPEPFDRRSSFGDEGFAVGGIERAAEAIKFMCEVGLRGASFDFDQDNLGPTVLNICYAAMARSDRACAGGCSFRRSS